MKSPLVDECGLIAGMRIVQHVLYRKNVKQSLHKNFVEEDYEKHEQEKKIGVQ